MAAIPNELLLKNVGNTITDIYTALTTNGTIFVDLTITNTTAATIQINIMTLQASTGNLVYELQNVPIVAGGTLVWIGNGGGVTSGAKRIKKLNENNVLKISSDTATSCDVSAAYIDL